MGMKGEVNALDSVWIAFLKICRNSKYSDLLRVANYAPLELRRLNRMACHPKPWRRMAERVGFEPTSPFGRTAFRERRLKPLGNLSDYLNQIKTIYSILNPS